MSIPLYLFAKSRWTVNLKLILVTPWASANSFSGNLRCQTLSLWVFSTIWTPKCLQHPLRKASKCDWLILKPSAMSSLWKLAAEENISLCRSYLDVIPQGHFLINFNVKLPFSFWCVLFGLRYDYTVIWFLVRMPI